MVLPLKKPKYLIQSYGKFKTASDYLYQPNYLVMREVAGVDHDIFYNWYTKFIDETSFFRRQGKNLLFIMDDYVCHFAYYSLSLLRNNYVIVIRLTADSLHIALDLGVFKPVKEDFNRLRSHCVN